MPLHRNHFNRLHKPYVRTSPSRDAQQPLLIDRDKLPTRTVVTLNTSYYFQITNPFFFIFYGVHVVSRALITSERRRRILPSSSKSSICWLILLGKPQELPIELSLERSISSPTWQKVKWAVSEVKREKSQNTISLSTLSTILSSWNNSLLGELNSTCWILYKSHL